MSAAPKPPAAPPEAGPASPMRRIRVEKVVVNIGVGQAGEQLIKGEKVLEMITGRKPSRTRSKTQNKELGIRVGMPIGAMVTLRGKPAETFLRQALDTRSNKINWYSFDAEGNFSFGVPDFTDFPNQKYDPAIGIFGMDVSVTLRRPGARVAKRRRARARVPRHHRITADEARAWVSERFDAEVV
ncbi:MAG TPA: 50S ribosomal protein L5 [Candidatus Thermoplasmatota archaeon]